VAPHPNFSKLRALRQHIIKALKQLECPQSHIHGWSGLTMAPNVYAILEPNPFVVPGDPGSAPVYTQFAPPAAIKMINATLKQDKNYFLSYKNINRACFCMLDDLVPNQFKVSNTPTLTGWNATMLIQVILNLLQQYLCLYKTSCRAEVVTSLRRSVTATSELMSAGCHLTHLASDLGQACQKYHCTVHNYICMVQI
jgi:hypothetical protein